MTNGNDSAHPTMDITDPYDRLLSTGGLTKREHFAAIAMQGILAGNPPDLVDEAENQGLLTKDAVAVTSLEFADALIAALNAQEAQTNAKS